MASISYSDIKKEFHKDPDFVRESEALTEEFQIADTLIRARMAAGLTQQDVAERMGTTQSAVVRMESGRSVSLKNIRTSFSLPLSTSMSLPLTGYRRDTVFPYECTDFLHRSLARSAKRIESLRRISSLPANMSGGGGPRGSAKVPLRGVYS
jgi:transcriptional regulator with XRE-family HTH domain